MHARALPSTGLLIAILAAMLLLAVRLDPVPSPHHQDQLPGLTYETRHNKHSKTLELVVTSVEDEGPAARSKIVTGDRIDRIDERPIVSRAAIGAAVRRDGARGVRLRLRHGGESRYRTLSATFR